MLRLSFDRGVRAIVVFGICFVGLCFCAAAQDLPVLVSVERIWDGAAHNAFTDLIRWRGRWWCTFREAADHVGSDGRIRILVSDNGEEWRSVALLTEDGIDLRDPKLSIAPNDRLMIVAGGSVYRGGRTLLGRQPRVAFSEDGATWTETRRVLAEGDWLWRVTWHQGTAWGVSYHGPEEGEDRNHTLTLVKSADGVDWQAVTPFAVTGRANETTLRFAGDRMIALVRREEDDQRGWVGASEPPYMDWNWTPIGHRLGGPNFVVMPDGTMWAGSRSYPDGAKMVIARMTETSYEPVLTLPSGGDCSYPGMVWHEGLLWVSYYASHEGTTSIYLAKVRLP